MGWKVGLTIPGAVLKERRTSLGHSQAEAGCEVGCNASTYGAWERRPVARISTRHAAAVRAYLRRSRPGSSGLNRPVSRGVEDSVCSPSSCSHYYQCVHLMHAGLWTVCEVEPPLEADLLRHNALLETGAYRVQDQQFSTEERTAELRAKRSQPTAKQMCGGHRPVATPAVSPSFSATAKLTGHACQPTFQRSNPLTFQPSNVQT